LLLCFVHHCRRSLLLHPLRLPPTNKNDFTDKNSCASKHMMTPLNAVILLL
jgi:hypothetical protein